MIRKLTAAIVLLASLLGGPCPAAAQVPVRSFDQLNTRLKPGDTIYVTDAQGREIVGRLIELGRSLLVVDDGVRWTLGPQDVRLIEERPADSKKNGTLLGLAIGAGGGVLTGVVVAYAAKSGSDEYAGAALLFGAMGVGAGAALGAIIDGAVPGPKRVVFRADSTPRTSSPRLSITLVITPRTKGVAVNVSF